MFASGLSFAVPALLTAILVQNSYIIGVDAINFIWSCFLVGSLVLAGVTIKLLSTYSGPGRRALKTGSIVLMIVYIFGFFGTVIG